MEFFVEWGYAGLFVLSFLAATVLPVGSEPLLLLMLTQGFKPMWCLVSATIGNTLGGATSYYIGHLGKWEWIEKYLKIKQEKILSFQHRIESYGVWVALLTWLPLIGDPIAIALGFFRITWWKVVIFMFIGKMLRYYLLIFSYEISGL
ncbi:MAG: DedA family protein [Flavobacteriales bacterium]|nr:DedA family protein [Flavobacteriales bacterium]